MSSQYRRIPTRAHHPHTRPVVTRSVAGVSVLGVTPRTLVVFVSRTMDTEVLAIIRRRVLHHILRSLRKPPVDEVSVHTIRATTRKLQWRGFRPTIWKNRPQVIADREAQARNPIHANRAAVLAIAIHPVRVGRISVFQGLWVRAVWEE